MIPKIFSAGTKLFHLEKQTVIEILPDEEWWCVRRRTYWYKYKVLFAGKLQNVSIGNILYMSVTEVQQEFEDLNKLQNKDVILKKIEQMTRFNAKPVQKSEQKEIAQTPIKRPEKKHTNIMDTNDDFSDEFLKEIIDNEMSIN